MSTQKRFQVITLAATLGLMALPAAAGQKQVDSRWEELSDRISGRTVTVTLPEGGTVQGHVRSVTAGTLEMDVTRTSVPRSIPKGSASLLRSSVHEVRVEEVRGSGRFLGTAVGLLGGALAGGSVAYAKSDLYYQTHGSTNLAIVGIIAGGTAAGYMAGRYLDHRITIIRIVEPAVVQP